MGRFLKILLIALAGVVGLIIVAAVALVLFFDPNDFKEEISAQVRSATGREFAIDGDISLSFFPWLAVEVGHSELGNAQGFGNEPFASFSSARLSVRLMPLLLRQEIAVGTASLQSLVLNLQVAADGRTNWEDLARAGEAETPAEQPEGAPPALDIANVEVSDAQLSYRDAQAGSAYVVSGLSIETGHIAPGETFDLSAEFEFEADPGDLGGELEIDADTTLGEGFATLAMENLVVAGRLRGIAAEATDLRLGARRIAVDTKAETVDPGEIDLEILGLTVMANAKPFSYAGDLDVRTGLRVLPFSLKDLMRKFGTEPPATADPGALTQVAFSADAAIDDTAMRLDKMSLELDDTTMTGHLSLPLTDAGRIEFDLAADSINVDSYMAPAGDTANDASAMAADEIEIPVDLIRSLKAHGTVKLARATLSGMLFEDMQLGLDSGGGKLRLHPISATLFEGTYGGDVRIDASTDTPSISVNEKIAGVSLTPLAQSLFDQENISGTINGSFVLSGRGSNLAAIRRDLDGNMAFELADGAWEGTDLWYQLRSARALFRKEQPPERRNPPRTEFTSVIASGKVTDGVFRNEDLLAELPFLQLSGKGKVDLVQGQVDYSLQARVLERPEFVSGASDAELADFTQAVIPLSITGPLSSPSIRPDIEGMLRAEVKKAVDKKKDELRDRVMQKLLGGEKPATNTAGEEQGAAGENEGEKTAQPEEEKDPEDKLKDSLKKLFDNQ